MSVTKLSKDKRVRFEIWVPASDITFAQNHLVSSGQSVKNYIESIFRTKVLSRRSKQSKAEL